MKRNPFYLMSAAAMLGGCYTLSRALDLRPGHIENLLILMGVLQLYEGLLIALGVFLVATRRASRDGLTLLVLESVFLMDATLLATECVTADTVVGTAVSCVVLALAMAKLALMRRVVPETLPTRGAVLIGVQAAFILALPVAAAHLASARLLGPIPLYLFWWLTLAQPLLASGLREEVETAPRRDESRLLAAWAYLPIASTLVHLTAVGWIHGIPFQVAFLTPLALGFALIARREAAMAQLVLPGVAVLLSLGRAAELDFQLIGIDAVPMSALRLALVGAAVTYLVIAWRHRQRWLSVPAAACFLAAFTGHTTPDIFHHVGRLLEALVPRSSFEWGVTLVVAAYVLLAIGARRSLRWGGGAPEGNGFSRGTTRIRW